MLQQGPFLRFTSFWSLLTLIERCDVCVCVVFVCWLGLEFVPLSVVLGTLGSLRLLSIPSFCLLSAPLSIVTASCPSTLTCS
jgi:hypothetical protein